MRNIYRGKTVVVTGHTGFKGAWLTMWLKKLGANVIGISNKVLTKPSIYESANINKDINDIRLDITDYKKLHNILSKSKPDIIFHLAAQALVGESYKDPYKTMQTNGVGTMNIVESLRDLNQKVTAVIITSDKVYDNVEWLWGYKETDQIGGKDPYSASKGLAELVLKSYYHSFFSQSSSKVKIAIARAGNVIGGGDWSEKRLVPDCVRAWSTNKPETVRNPESTRPWQHVLEPLGGYLLLGSKLYLDKSLNGESFNFGPNDTKNYSVKELIDEMSEFWSKASWQIPKTKKYAFNEANLLKLN